MCEPVHEVVREVILRRRSVRSYEPKPLDDAVLVEILRAGQQAPSAANRQPWQFVVVRDPERRKALAEACNGQTWLADAGALIVGLGLPAVSERWYRVDVAIAMQNMIIAATSFGLGTCWIGAFNEEKVKQVIGAPDGVSVVAITPVGVPKGEWPKARSRRELSQVFSSEVYGQPLGLN
ncbi:MAG: nitroreductase family protein [Anaerolineae bacterium]